ncbi:MAG TPA: trypsin-like peptidase domain-containing protein [Actinomycetes bacterium]|nr:trypsin-like peptidase domain-containing protein [Actinomycetes bacterium]
MTNSYPTAPVPDPFASPPQPTPATTKKRTHPAVVVATAALAGALGAGVGATAVIATDDNSPASTSSATAANSATQASLPANSVAKVAQTVLPSVVSIQFTGAAGSGSGSGVVISDDGLILTNNHVVETAANGGSLTVNFSDGTSTDAEIVGRDPSADLAVIRVHNVDNLVPATLGSSDDLKVGETVVAIGSPLGLSGTVTTGIVSAKNRPVSAGSGEPGAEPAVLNAIQTDAAINPGNSGGALVNLKGQVVGINSAIATLGASTGGQSGSIGLGFAIPIDQAKWIVDQLVANGQATHAQLGVSVGDATGNELGAELQSVESGTPASAAGLQSGDVVTRFNGQAIESADALVAAVRSVEPGTQVTLEYVRNGNTSTTSVTLGDSSAT